MTFEPDTDRAADLVLVGGRVFTADAARSWAGAFAVRDGRIVAVGGDREVRRLVGPRTRVIELRGRTVTPGFVDAHTHPVSGGVEQLRIDLTGLRGLDAYHGRIRAWADANPDAPWLHGGGWSLPDFVSGIPTAAALDAMTGDRPAFLTNRDGHDAWVNTAALAAAGIDATTPDPPGGRISRDADGVPVGALHESAMDLVARLLPPDRPDELELGLRNAQRYFHSLGVTGWQDASVGPEMQAAYEAVAGRGELTARVVAAMTWDPARPEAELAAQVEELVARRARTPVGRFAATSVKIFADGIIETFTAAMLDPYLDRDGRATGDRGITYLAPARFADVASALDAQGFQVHVHAIGDRAVRDALDAFSAMRARNGWSDARPHIAHLQVVHPDDLPRFRSLGVTANAQAYWAVHEAQMDELTIPFLGPERAGWQYPWRSLLRHGATLAMGSDWSVSTPDPLAQIEVAVTRVSDEDRGASPFLPDERLSLADALAAFTAGSAHVCHLDDAGSIRPGALADFAVIDRDLFDRGAGPIGDARVVGTWVDGVAVYEDPALGG
jgi:predicted amidohydrolase YtcJ